jgi:hypothetical protein
MMMVDTREMKGEKGSRSSSRGFLCRETADLFLVVEGDLFNLNFEKHPSTT